MTPLITTAADVPQRGRLPGDAHPDRYTHSYRHVPALPVGSDEPFWHYMIEVYAATRAALQMISGLQLLGTSRPEERDLRNDVLLRVRLLLVEAGDWLRRTPTVPRGEARYVEEVRWCLRQLQEVATVQLSTRSDEADGRSIIGGGVLARLEGIGQRLCACQRYDLGIRFFGSGGCADSEHGHLHLCLEDDIGRL